MALIQIVSEEGDCFNVNKYFLQLYNTFFYNLIEDHINDDINIIFTKESNAFIELLVNNVINKHINCKDANNHDNENIHLPQNDSKSEALKLNKKMIRNPRNIKH